MYSQLFEWIQFLDVNTYLGVCENVEHERGLAEICIQTFAQGAHPHRRVKLPGHVIKGDACAHRTQGEEGRVRLEKKRKKRKKKEMETGRGKRLRKIKPRTEGYCRGRC